VPGQRQHQPEQAEHRAASTSGCVGSCRMASVDELLGAEELELRPVVQGPALAGPQLVRADAADLLELAAGDLAAVQRVHRAGDADVHAEVAAVRGEEQRRIALGRERRCGLPSARTVGRYTPSKPTCSFASRLSVFGSMLTSGNWATPSLVNMVSVGRNGTTFVCCWP
jgi:hypothetical protein